MTININSGNFELNHERAGLEADVSAGDGFVEIKAGATTVIKSNLAAAVAPTVNEDSDDGYAIGSRWIDTTADKEYVLLDATVAAADWTETTARTEPYIHIQHQVSSGVEGGTFTSGSYQTRTLNTEVTDTDNLASLASNQITLEAGTYLCSAQASTYIVNGHKMKLYDTTGTADLLFGTVGYSPVAEAATNKSFIIGYFTIGVQSVLEIQHRCQTTRATNGFGLSNIFGDIEIHADVQLWKVG